MSTTPATPAPALDDASRKSLRDLMFAWTYVSISQLGNLTSGARTADDVIGDLQSNISIPPGSQMDQDVRTYISQIQANPASFTSVANTFRGAATTTALSSPWDGPPRHPSLGELNLVMADV